MILLLLLLLIIIIIILLLIIILIMIIMIIIMMIIMIIIRQARKKRESAPFPAGAALGILAESLLHRSALQDSSKGGAVETGCSDLSEVIH